MRVRGMLTGISITLSDADRRRLESIATNRNASQKHVWRSRIVLMTAQGAGTNAIMAATGRAKTTVWRWQERFMAQGVDGLLQDPPARQAARSGRARREGRRDDAEAAAARGHALDGARDGQGVRPRRVDGTKHLESARPRAASLAQLQALQRPRLRREASRHDRFRSLR